jgi:hypothetical protein
MSGVDDFQDDGDNTDIYNGINISNWFNKITGIDEEDWDFDINSLSPFVANHMGSFSQISFGDLKKMLASNPKMHTKNIRLTLVLRGDTGDESQFDTSALQFNGQSGTMYQVASNFNCQELAHEKVDVFHGQYLNGVMNDGTQGPSATGGTICGGIRRLDEHKKKPIDLLDNTNLKPLNGKLYSKKVSIEDIEKLNVDDIKVGLHCDVSANFDRSVNLKFNPDGPIIDQVYTSTCICDNRKPNKLSEKLLMVAYEATYLCAVMRQNKKLVLTLIGGGCFKNSYEQILAAILNAHQKYAQYLHKSCEVVLPIYDSNLNSGIMEFIHKHKTIYNFIQTKSV